MPGSARVGLRGACSGPPPAGQDEPRARRPRRDAQREGPRLRGIRQHANPHRTRPRVVRRDVERDVLPVGERRADRRGRVLVQLDARGIRRREVPREARERARRVRRAARHVEPGRAQRGLRPRRHRVGVGLGARAALVQRVRVVERGAGGARRRLDHVEERALDLVGVARIALREQQPPAEHHGCHARTGLGVGAVRRQLPVLAERLVLVVRALPAGHVGAALDGRRPTGGRARCSSAVVAGLDGDVGRARREVVRAHRVAAQHVGVAHGDVVLVVRATPLDVAQRASAVALDEEARLLEVARLAERPAELRQPDLDLGVAADALDAALAEHLAHEVGRAARDVDEAVVGVGPRAHPGDGRLEQVPEAVQLVPPLEVGPPGPLARAGRTACSGSRRAPAPRRPGRPPRGSAPRARRWARPRRPGGRSPRPSPRGTCRPRSPRTRVRGAPRAGVRMPRGRSCRASPRARAIRRCARGSRGRSPPGAGPRTRP